MAYMLSELYEALLDIGVDPDKARKAAEAAALPNQEIAAVRTDIALLRGQVEHLAQRLTHLMWSVGIGVSLLMAVLLVELNWLWQLMQRRP